VCNSRFQPFYDIRAAGNTKRHLEGLECVLPFVEVRTNGRCAQKTDFAKLW